MPKRKSDLITLSKLYLNTNTNCFRRQYYALKPREESEAMRLGREIHRNFERDRANSPTPVLGPIYEDKIR